MVVTVKSKLEMVLKQRVATIVRQPWDVRGGKVVPKNEALKLAGGGVREDAALLYADLADSTELAMRRDSRVVAKVYKCFLSCASLIVRAEHGAVRSFDGDRIMGVFVGPEKETRAARCALKINYCMLEIVRPRLSSEYPDLESESYRLSHCVGVDAGTIFAVRGGIRESNDLIWIGRAPNVAAKLSSIRKPRCSSFITDAVYDMLDFSLMYDGAGQPMWTEYSFPVAGESLAIYGSDHWHRL